MTLGYGSTLGENVSFSAGMGINSADNITEGEDSYIDYNVGVSFPVNGLDIGVTVVGTNIDDNDDAAGRLVLSLSKSL